MALQQVISANLSSSPSHFSGDRPIFLCVSQSLNNTHSAEAIRRLSPGYCLRVHRKPIFVDDEDPTQLDEPTLSLATQASNIRTTSISFLTISSIGWGLNYRHLYVTDCPVRYEIVFSWSTLLLFISTFSPPSFLICQPMYNGLSPQSFIFR
jgi:hypothetical protein